MMNSILYWILYILLYLFSLLPLKVHYFFSDIAAFFLSKVLRYRSDVVDINLARSFPDLKYWEIKKIKKDFYRYMTDVMIETIWSFTSRGDKVASMLNVKNPQVLDKVVAEYGKAIVVMGHKGNWEMIGALSGKKADRYPGHYSEAGFVIAYKGLSSKVMDRLMHRIRSEGYRKFDMPGEIVESSDLFRYMVRNRDRKNIYFMIADQSSPYPKFIADFMHQKTSVFNGPEFIARKMDIPVVYMNSRRTGRGHYDIEYRLLCEKPSESGQGEITSGFMKMLQEDINESRYDWLWSHKRWKKRIPDNDEKLIYL